jgi:hypothetical protein
MPPRLFSLAFALITGCFPVARQDSGMACWSLVNGDAELGDLTGWVADPPDAVAAVERDDFDGLGITPASGDRFFSFAHSEADLVRLTHRCGPAPAATACTISGWVHTAGTSQLAARATASVHFLDEAGDLLASTSSEAMAYDEQSWQHFELWAEVPSGAQEIAIVLEGSLRVGEVVHVGWDDLVLRCTDGVTGAS